MEKQKVYYSRCLRNKFILLKKKLETSDVSVFWVKDGQDLLQLVEEKKYVDLILLDISMPKIDGYEITKILRNSGIVIPIIAQSSFFLDSEINSILEAGCYDYISKPIIREELFSKISALLYS